jgi:hypothetical protein
LVLVVVVVLVGQVQLATESMVLLVGTLVSVLCIFLVLVQAMVVVVATQVVVKAILVRLDMLCRRLVYGVKALALLVTVLVPLVTGHFVVVLVVVLVVVVQQRIGLVVLAAFIPPSQCLVQPLSTLCHRLLAVLLAVRLVAVTVRLAHRSVKAAAAAVLRTQQQAETAEMEASVQAAAEVAAQTATIMVATAALVVTPKLESGYSDEIPRTQR